MLPLQEIKRSRLYRVSNFEINDGYLFPSSFDSHWSSADRGYLLLVDVPTGEGDDATTAPSNNAVAAVDVADSTGTTCSLL